MIVHQAYYGEKNKGHSLICSSFESNEIPKKITLNTDLPSNSSNINWKPFYSGFATQEHYVFLKTYPDKNAGRGSFVFTHALFIENKNLESLNDLFLLLDLFPKDFVRSDSLSPIEFLSDNSSKKKPIDQASLAMISELLEDNKVIWSGEDGFINVVDVLWNSIYAKNRTKFSFRLSFSYKDYERSNLTIAYTPVEVSDKWIGYKIIDKNNVNKIENEAIDFVTKTSNSKIYKLGKEIGKQPENIQELKKWQLFAEEYYAEDRDIFTRASLVREIEQISSSPNECTIFKSQLLSELIDDLKIGNLKGLLLLRNISLKPFNIKEVEESLLPVFKNLIKASVESNKEENDLIKTLKSTISEEVEEWWKVQVKKVFKVSFAEFPEQISKLLWNLIKNEKEFLNKLNELIPINTKSESTMILTFPKSLNNIVLEGVLNFSKENKWNSLFGTAIKITYNKLDEGIEFLKSVSTGKELELRLKAYATVLSVKDFIKLGARSDEDLLMDVTIDLLIENPKHKDYLSLKTTEEINVLEKTINRGVAFCEGFSNSIAKRDELLDSFAKGEEVSDVIWEELKLSKLSDLSLYSNRTDLWNKIPSVHRSQIILKTAEGWIYNYLKGKITTEELEVELKAAVRSNNLLKNVMSNKGHQLSKILDLFILIDVNLESDYKTLIEERVKDFDKNNCDRLSKLVVENKWKGIYKYAKSELISKNYHFQILVNNCEDEFKSTDEKIVEAIFGKKKKNKMKKHIFISYSRKDIDFKDELRVHLKPLVRSEMISEWACEDIRSGEWNEQIQTKLEEADIIIYMVSANFMASDYIIDNEVKVGIEIVKKDTSKKIMCILVRECIWRDWSLLDENFEETNSSDLSRFQFLPYYKDNGKEELLSIEEWGIGNIKPKSVAYKQIMDKLIAEIK